MYVLLLPPVIKELILNLPAVSSVYINPDTIWGIPWTLRAFVAMSLNQFRIIFCMTTISFLAKLLWKQSEENPVHVPLHNNTKSAVSNEVKNIKEGVFCFFQSICLYAKSQSHWCLSKNNQCWFKWFRSSSLFQVGFVLSKLQVHD